MDEEEIICPHCGSDNCYKNRKPGWLTALFILMFGIPLLFPSRNMHCFDCGQDFKRERKH